MTRRWAIGFVGLMAVLIAVVGESPLHAGLTAARSPMAQAQQPPDQIAFVSDRDGDADIYLVSAAGGVPANLTGGLTGSAQDAGPTWSPNGDRLAFASTREGTWDLYVLTLADMTLERVTRSPGTEFDPAWSPDGETLAFERTAPDGNRDISSVPSGGGQITNLTNDGAIDLDPAWDRNGSVMFESDRGGTFDTYAVSRRGGSPKALQSGGGEKFHLAGSPDGAKVAYERGIDGNYDLYLFDRATAAATRITGSQAEDSEPAWAPGGDRLAFTTSRDGQYEIYVLDLGTATTTRLTRSRAGADISPAWRPVGGSARAALDARAAPPAPLVARAADIACTRHGTNAANTMHGNTGADTLCGKAGNDKIYGGRGRDRLLGDTGRDRLYGNAGADTLYGGGNGGGKGADRLRGGEHSDRLFARGDKARDCVWGNSGAADWGRLDIGTKSWSDNRNSAPFGGDPCGQKSTIEAWD